MLPTPLKVNAAEDNTSKYLYVIGTIAAYGGIDIDVNSVATRFPNFVDDVMALADEIYTEYAETYGWTNDTESGHTGGGSHRDGSDGVIQAADDIQGYLDYLVSGLKPFNPVASLVEETPPKVEPVGTVTVWILLSHHRAIARIRQNTKR